MNYRLTLWGGDARIIGESYWDSLSEARKVARTAGKNRAEVFSATIKTPRGIYHHYTF